MNITPVRNINFTGKIIDAHMHIGSDKEYRTEEVLKYFDQAYDGDTLEFGIISNVDCMGGEHALKDEVQGNLATIIATESNPDKFIPIAVGQPRKGSAETLEAVLRGYNSKAYTHKFKGLKFHPEGEQLSANHKKYEPYLKLAQKYHLPCLFHCEIPWKQYTKKHWDLVMPWERYSDPRQVYAAAKKIPDTPVVMAHMGAGGEKVHKVALDCLLKSIKNGDSLLYADISWVDCKNPQRPFLIKAIKELQNTPQGDMTHRLIFGTDAPIGEYTNGWETEINGDKITLSGRQYYEKEVADTKQAIRDNFEPEVAEKLIEDIFYNNAKRLYIDKDWA